MRPDPDPDDDGDCGYWRARGYRGRVSMPDERYRDVHRLIA